MKKRESVDTVTHGYLNNNGITLIALVITIIMLLILAGVVIVTLTGDNGLLQKATNAKIETIEAEGLEKIQLAVLASQDKDGINTTSLANNLKQINGLTDINNQAITEITLPKSVKLNNTKYDIKEDGTVIINNSLLPAEYQQVEYIESSGTQWIDTGLKGGLDTLGVDFKFNVNNTRSYYVLGNFNQVGQCGVMREYKNNNKTDVMLIYYINNSENTINIGLVNEDIVFSNKDSNIKANSNLKGTIPNTTRRLTNSNLCLYGTGIGTSFNASGKIYYLKIYDDLSQTNLIRNFIPCYSTTAVIDVNGKQCTAGTIGLYDTANRQFYVNKGSGTFGYETEDGTYVAPFPTNN